VALRRTTRVGDQAGVPVEDLGVKPDEVYLMSRDDLLGKNEGLIARAAAILAQQKVRLLSAKVDTSQRPAIVVRTEARNLSRVDFYLAGRPLGSVAVRDGRATLTLPDGAATPGVLELHGFDDGQLFAIARLSLT
jgi:hypothetical protein